MQSLGFLNGGLSGKTLLCLGAHSDDIEIGCGATVQKIVRANPGVAVHWVVFSAKGDRAAEARASAEQVLRTVGNATIVLKEFRNGFFPYVATEIKEFFETIKQTCQPDLILSHYRHDLHQDHRQLAELTWNTFRNHLILEYEIPKFDGDLGVPNTFVTLTEVEIDEKISLLMTHFGSQRDKQWFSADTFKGLSHLRGIECCSPSGFAEAFYGRKLVLL